MNYRRMFFTLFVTLFCLTSVWFSISRAARNENGLSSNRPAATSENKKHVPELVSTAKTAGIQFETRELFQSDPRSISSDSQLRQVLNAGTVLTLDKSATERIVREGSGYLTLPLPNGRGQVIELELVRVNIFAPEFSVKTAKPTNESYEDSLGIHYSGIVKGDMKSVAAVSIFKNEVMCLYSTQADGNFVVGRLGGNNPNDNYIAYAERDMKVRSPFHCNTKDTVPARLPRPAMPESSQVATNCVRMYVEANVDIFIDKGSSIPNVTRYLTGLFNESATLFRNDGINVLLSELFVWNVASPYTGGTSTAQLNTFVATRPNFNGQTAHLLTLQSNIGGLAYVGVVCFLGAERHGFSGIDPTYLNVPTYSWSTEVFTHEAGHNLGSQHTHACAWNGNNTAIDGCAPVEGMCPTPPAPPGGGTIMSYCHLGATGINFANGFGPQPSARIQQHVAGGACTTSCAEGRQGSIVSDFDGDRKSDIAVYRASNGGWYQSRTSDGFAAVAFGTAGDLIAPGDYDGDGQTDAAVFRPSTGTWYMLRSNLGFTAVGFGANGDLPAPGDFDRDGITDVAVFRPSTGIWYVQRSQLGFFGMAFGTNGDVPVVGDYDGDGRADIAVYRASNGGWYMQQSTAGFAGVAFGTAGDKPTPGDYDGDGRTDVAVFRPSTGTWYAQRSQLGIVAFGFGTNGDLPAPGDYDGDGKSDFAVFRPSTGSWYVQKSTQGFFGQGFGTNGDIPIGGAYVP